MVGAAGGRHGYAVTGAAAVPDPRGRARRLGEVLAGETGVCTRRRPRLSPRGADVALFAGEGGRGTARGRGCLEPAPDPAVAVDDPSGPGLRRKAGERPAAGARAVRVADPEAGTLARHPRGGAPRVHAGADAAGEEPVLPGFRRRPGEIPDPA
jgi:hypothetical protein